MVWCKGLFQLAVLFHRENSLKIKEKRSWLVVLPWSECCSGINGEVIYLCTAFLRLLKIEPLARGATKILSFEFRYLHPPLSY